MATKNSNPSLEFDDNDVYNKFSRLTETMIDVLGPKFNGPLVKACDPSDWPLEVDPSGYITKAQQIAMYQNAGKQYDQWLDETFPGPYAEDGDVGEGDDDAIYSYREDSEMDVVDKMQHYFGKKIKTPKPEDFPQVSLPKDEKITQPVSEKPGADPS